MASSLKSAVSANIAKPTAPQQVGAQLLQSGAFTNYCKPAAFSSSIKPDTYTGSKTPGKTGQKNGGANPTGYANRILGKESGFFA